MGAGMSISFFIQDINNKGCITVGQMFDIGGGNYKQYSYAVDKDSELYDKFIETKLDNFECMLLGIEGKCAKCFELSFDEYYSIKLFSPCSLGDFEAAFGFIKRLCAFLENNEVLAENGEKYNADDIEKYPYREHILAGIKQGMDILQKNNYKTIDIECINRTVSFNEQMFTEIMASEDPVAKFSKLITDIQYIYAYSAKQKFFESEDGTIMCTYALTETVPTILPYSPVVEDEYSDMFKNKDVTLWTINLVGINGDPCEMSSYEVLGQMNYEEFIKRLPKEKYSFIDAKYILVEPLDACEIRQILNKD